MDTVPSDVLGAARLAMRETFRAGNPLSQNQLQERFGLSRAQSREVRLEVVAEQQRPRTHLRAPAGALRLLQLRAPAGHPHH